MKVTEVEDENGKVPVITEVYSGAYIETSEGNRIGFCLRDDAVEINVLGKGPNRQAWHRVDMQSLTIERM